VRQDEYYWLRDDSRTDPKMLAYLEAENAYADARLAPLAALKDQLYGELVGRIKQDDSSVPYRENGYWYYTRFEEGVSIRSTRAARTAWSPPKRCCSM
jgi:oligopeptidase B